MTRGTIRGLVRRWIQEITPEDFSDEQLNDIINDASLWVEGEILAHDQVAFISVATSPINAGVDLYSKPVGMWWELEIGYKDSAAQLGYRPLVRKDYQIARDQVEGNLPVYCHVGRFIGVYPVPSATVDAGLRFLYVPSLTMAADTDVSDIHLVLHQCIAIKASKLALGEERDVPEYLEKELAEGISKIPFYYQKSGENDRLWIDPEFLRGRYRDLRNGVYQRDVE